MTFDTRLVTANEMALSVSDWSKRTGLSVRVINYRLSSGWSTEKSIGLSATNGNNQHMRYDCKRGSKMTEAMTMALAQKIVDSRIKNPRETWRESVEAHAPHMKYLSVKAYVSKFKRGEIKERQEKVPVVHRKLDYAIINKAWV